MSLVRNEQAKLTANYLNGVAVAVFAVGGLGSLLPAVSALVEPTPFSVLVSAICFMLSFALHWTGRHVLRRLEP